MTGYAGWAFLKRTHASQMRIFKNSFEINKDIKHYKSNIDKIKKADDLINDRHLLKLSLGAFGLSDDIDSQFFVKRILEDGTNSRNSLSNKMADSRYKDLSKFFGFGDQIPTGYSLKHKVKKLTEDYTKVMFEEAVGKQDETLRLALFGHRTMHEIAEQLGSEKSKWFKILGTPPLRKIFETALNLPSTFSQIDLDTQVKIIKEQSSRKLKMEKPSELKDKDTVSRIVDRFVLQSEIKATAASISSSSVALTLLQSTSTQYHF